MGLSERAGDRLDTYSGGMKRRANIAAGLLHEPRLLFVDEPTVGIDPQSRRRILELVKGLRAEGVTILYTTHYMEEAQELSDRVSIVEDGRLVALGTPMELTAMLRAQETVRLRLDREHANGRIGDLFAGLPGVLHTAAEGDQLLQVLEAAPVLPELLRVSHARGLPGRSIDIERPNLEAVFLHLTGHALRD